MTRMIATGGMKQAISGSLRKTAAKTSEVLPELGTADHLRDAAKAAAGGHHDSAGRHMAAAMHTLSPLSLARHGVRDDAGHAHAKRMVDTINRHALLLKDVEEAEQANEQARAEKQAALTAAKAEKIPARAVGQQPGDSEDIGANASGGTPGGYGRAAGLASPLELASGPAPYHHEWDEVVTCPYCGKGNSDDARFCDQCGRKMPDSAFADLSNISLSAQTGRLAVQPAPIGRPGGPGAYDVKGMQFPPYFQNIRNALIRSGHSVGSASAITWGSIRKWAGGSGNVHPEVRAAAQKALADLGTMSARAHTDHSNRGYQSIDLAAPPPAGQQPKSQAKSQNAEAEARVPKGQFGGGRFGAGGGAAKGKGVNTNNAARAGRLTPKIVKSMSARQKAMARAVISQRLTTLHGQVRALEAQIKAAGKTKAKSPAAAAAAAKKAASTKAAPAASTAAAAKGTSTTAKAAAKTAAKAPMTTAQMASKITSLRGQIASLNAERKLL
jgi:hypothetical protein